MPSLPRLHMSMSFSSTDFLAQIPPSCSLHLPPSGPRQSSCWTCWPLDEAGASSSHCHCPRPIQGSFFSLPHMETALWWPLQMGMEGGRRQGHNLDDRSSVTRTEARRFLIWWGKGMRATAVERSKAPWPQWPALDRLPLSGRGSSVLLPSGHRPRAAPSVVGACLRERTRGTAGAHQHHHTHTQKKSSLSPSVGPRRAFLPTVLALFGCPFWCLSSVLLGLNVLCAVSPRPAHHTEPLGVSASMQSRHLQSAQHLVVLPVLSLTWGIHLPPHHQF